MTRDALIDGLSLPGVLPILPAAAGILTILLTALLSIVVATVTLRPRAWVTLLKAAWRQKWGLLVLVVLGVTVIRVAALVKSPEPIPGEPSELIAGQWPMFRGGLTRTGHADELPGPSSGGVQWTGGRGFEFLASPSVAGERVLAIGIQGDSARVFAWDADTGAQDWTVAPHNFRATFSSPVIHDGLFVCGEGLHSTSDARVLCLDLRRRQDEQNLMLFRTSSHVECTPTVSEGRIYVNAGDDGIYCLAVDREQSALEVVWHASDSELYPDAETALAVYDGFVYVGLGHGGEALCKLAAETGSEVVRKEMPWPVFSPPAILDDRLYVGMGRADYVNTDDPSAGEVQCLDLESLEEIWTFPTSAAVLSAIAVDRGEVVFSTVDGEVVILDQEGQEQRRWRAAARMVTAPAVTDRMVYCVANDGVLTGLTRHDLRPAWNVRLGAPGRYTSSPIVFRGRVYVGTPADGFVCAGEPTTVMNDELWSSRLGGPGAAGAQRNSPIPVNVAVAWTLSGPSLTERADVSAPPAIAGSDLVVPMTSPDWSGLVCVDWQHPLAPIVRWKFSSPAPIRVSPVISSHVVACVCGERGQSGESVAIDRRSGAELWRGTVTRVSDTLATDGKSLMLSESDRHLARYSLEGDRQWRQDVGRQDHPIDVSGPIIVSAATSPLRVLALDAVTGRGLWEAELRNAPVDSPVIVDRRIVIPTAAGIEVRSLLDGSLLSTRNDIPSSPLSVDGDQLIGIATSGDLFIGSTFSHGPSRRQPGAMPGLAPLVASNAVVFVGDNHRLLFWSPDRNEPPRLWFDVGDSGEVSHSPLLHDNHVFVPVAGAGLICLESSRP